MVDGSNNADKEAIGKTEIQNILWLRTKDMDIRAINISTNTLNQYDLIIHIKQADTMKVKDLNITGSRSSW